MLLFFICLDKWVCPGTVEVAQSASFKAVFNNHCDNVVIENYWLANYSSCPPARTPIPIRTPSPVRTLPPAPTPARTIPPPATAVQSSSAEIRFVTAKPQFGSLGKFLILISSFTLVVTIYFLLGAYIHYE
jgi:hypothetical protein